MNIKKWMKHWLTADRKFSLESVDGKIYCTLEYDNKRILVKDECVEKSVINAIREYNIRKIDDDRNSKKS